MTTIAAIERAALVLAGAAGLYLLFRYMPEGLALGEDVARPYRVLSLSLWVSVPAIPAGLILTGFRPSLWPVPLAALAWSGAVIALLDPGRFDVLIEALMQFSAQK